VSRSPCILAVEDSQANQLVVRRYCEGLGCGDVQVVSSGEEALVQLARRPFDLVLMDVEMPRMDGLETTRRIRDGEAGESSRQVVVVAMTSHSFADNMELFQEAGMDDYVAKPLTVENLGKVLERNLGFYAGQGAAPPVSSRQVQDEEPSGYGSLLCRDTALERMGNDQAIYDELKAVFLCEHPRQLQALLQAMEQGDAERQRRKAHHLKNLYRTLGAVSCGRLSAEIESAAAAGETGRARELVARLEREAARLGPMLQS